MNLAKWNSLPDHLKKLMLDVKEEAEPLIDKAVAKSYAESWEFIHDKERGIEHIEWSAADTKWFLTQIDEASWVDVSNHLGVDTTIKLRKLLSK
jgi:TRAP-type C4-dicarboxylate transport system substrate-binding protein